MDAGPDAIHTTAAELDAVAHRAARKARLLPSDTEPNHANALREAANAAAAAASQLQRALLDHPQQRLHVEGRHDSSMEGRTMSDPYRTRTDRAARYAERAIKAERNGRHQAASRWKERLAYMIESTAAHRTPDERVDLYHTELSDARDRHDPHRHDPHRHR